MVSGQEHFWCEGQGSNGVLGARRCRFPQPHRFAVSLRVCVAARCVVIAVSRTQTHPHTMVVEYKAQMTCVSDHAPHPSIHN
jgi:hypothetical protein